MNRKLKSRLLYLLTGTFYVLHAAMSVSIAFLFQRGIDAASRNDLTTLITSMLVVLIIVMPLEFMTAIIAARSRMGFVREMLMTVKDHRMAFIFARQPKIPLTDNSSELSFFTADVDVLKDSYFNPIARLPLYVAYLLFALLSLFWINWILTIVAIAVTVLPMMISHLFKKGLQRRSKDYSNSVSAYVDIASECIQGRREIVAYNKQPKFLNRHEDSNRDVENARLNRTFFSAIANSTSNALGGLTQVVIFGLGSYFVISGSMTFGYMIAVVQLMNYVFVPVQNIVETFNNMHSAKPVLEKANEMIASEAKKSQVLDFNHSLDVCNLGIKYKDDFHILRGINLSFKKGGKYALRAPSGFGKTSIARALAMEFMEFDGSISLDGKDIRELDIHSYHKILRCVHQDPYLFSGTAMSNLTFFEDSVDNDELEKVVLIAHVNEFLPDSEALSRPISNTSGLSGGQKQRIALARALLHKPSILILDEITSGIDFDTAYNILFELFKDEHLTCIVITHENNEKFNKLFHEVIVL